MNVLHANTSPGHVRMANCVRKFEFQRLRSYTLGVPQGEGWDRYVRFISEDGNNTNICIDRHLVDFTPHSGDKAVVNARTFGGNKKSSN